MITDEESEQQDNVGDEALGESSISKDSNSEPISEQDEDALSDKVDQLNKSIDDIGRLGKPLSDKLWNINDLETSVYSDDDDLTGGQIDGTRPITPEDMGFEFSEPSGEDDPSLWAFGVSVDAKTFTIQAGKVNLWGIASIAVNGGDEDTPTTINYGGSDMQVWVSVKFDIAATSASIAITASYPVAETTFVYWPLARFKKIAAADPVDDVYASDGNGYILYRGDINVFGPTVWSNLI